MAFFQPLAFLLVASFAVSITEGLFHCHPKRKDAYVGPDYEVYSCNNGLAFSTKLQTCVSPFLSECAGEIEQITNKDAISEMCDTLPAGANDTNSLVSFRCSPEDANQFVVCPPNTIWAALMRCPENMLFSLKDRKCVDDVATDCALYVDMPSAASMTLGDVLPDVAMSNETTASNETTNASNETDVAEQTPDAGPMRSVPFHQLPYPRVGSLPHSPMLPPHPNGPLPAVPGVPGGNPHPVPYLPQVLGLPSNSYPADLGVPFSAPSNVNPSGPVNSRPVVRNLPVVPNFPAPVPNFPAPVPNFPAPVRPMVTPARPAQSGPVRPVCTTRYAFHPEKADWEGARLICEMDGGQLAVITGEKQQGTIGSRFGKEPEFWVGATDIEREGQFRWVNGQGLGFARWYSSQPNKKYPNTEDCVTFNYWGKDTKWGDRNCHDSRPFLCERTVCRAATSRFPQGYPNSFRGPLRNPFQFPRNQNFPGPQGLDGIATQNWPRGRGFPYNRFQQIRTPINNG